MGFPLVRCRTTKGDDDMASKQDGRQGDHGQGDVKHPETDRRLKENRGSEGGQSGGQHADNTGQRGQVKDPEHDGRLKENRDQGISKHTTDGRQDVEHGGQGRVKDPENDGRLKENR
jgi:hypothetical protein